MIELKISGHDIKLPWGKAPEKADLQKIQDEARSINEAFKRLFATPDGAIVLGFLVRQGHMFENTTIVGDRDLSNIREGERRFLLSILAAINRDPETLKNKEGVST